MATHSSILACRIPWTEEPGGLQSMGSQRVGHDWVTNTTLYVCVQSCTHLVVLHSVRFYHVSTTTKILIRSRPTSTSILSPSPPPSPFPTLGNLCSAFHFYIFAISRMSYRWNYGVYNLWDWLFFTVSIIPLRFIQIVCIYCLFLSIA